MVCPIKVQLLTCLCTDSLALWHESYILRCKGCQVFGARTFTLSHTLPGLFLMANYSTLYEIHNESRWIESHESEWCFAFDISKSYVFVASMIWDILHSKKHGVCKFCVGKPYLAQFHTCSSVVTWRRSAWDSLRRAGREGSCGQSHGPNNVNKSTWFVMDSLRV